MNPSATSQPTLETGCGGDLLSSAWTNPSLCALASRLGSMHDLAGRFRMQTDAAAVMDLIVASARTLIPFDEMLIAETACDPDGDPCPPGETAYRLCMSSAQGLYAAPQTEARRKLTLFRGGLLGRMLASPTARLFREIGERDLAGDPAAEFVAGMRCALAVPLPRSADSLAEVLLFTAGTPHRFTEDDLAEAVVLANFAAVMVGNLWLTEQFRQATYRRLNGEMQIVADIQRGLLPAKLPAIPGWSMACHYATSDAVGGDYYDFYHMPAGRVGLLVADASGHGASAAVVMAVTRTLLRAAGPPEDPPHRLLARLNARLPDHIVTGHFVTALAAALDPVNGLFEYALAGHPPPYMVRRGSADVEELANRGGLPLGIFPTGQFNSEIVRLGPGDTILLYTDGVIEAMNRRQELFGEGPVKEVLASHASFGPEAVRDEVLRRLRLHTAGAATSDDMTLLVLRRDS